MSAASVAAVTDPLTPDAGAPDAPAPGDTDAMMTLGDAALAQLAPFGTERDVAVGDELFRAGDPTYDFFVDLALEDHLEAEAVTVESPALVRLRKPEQAVGGLEAVLADELGAHGDTPIIAAASDKKLSVRLK